MSRKAKRADKTGKKAMDAVHQITARALAVWLK
jgi:hypothetical protein